jgi:4-amino-4-deoxy-L-arabinose transferase-like glycosyltransferase
VTWGLRRAGLWRGLAPILAVACAVRLAWVLAAPVDPREDFLWDMTFYDLAALQLTDGALLRDLDGVATARWTPGYPLLLGGAYAIFGSDLLVGKLLNVVLATFTVAITGLLGARLFGRGPGLAAAALLALLPGYVLYAPLLLSETAFVALFTASLLLFACLDARRPETSATGWLGFGVLLGAAILVRGAALLFLAVPALVAWRSTGSARIAARRTALAALGLAAVIAPWTLRNTVLLGAPVLLSTQQVGCATPGWPSSAICPSRSGRWPRIAPRCAVPSATC